MTAGTGHGDWHRDGWHLVPGFLSAAELTMLRDEAERLLARTDLFEQRGAVVNSTRRSDRLDPVIDVSPSFAAVARDGRLPALVNDFLDGQAQLFKDKFIAKPPGAIGYIAHQDGAYWPGMGLDPARFLTAIIFLDDANADNGAIECAANPYRQLLTDPGQIADVDESELGDFQVIEAKAGDLLLLHAFTPHRSGPNRSQSMRRTLLFTYGVDARPDLYGIYQRLRSAGE